MKKITNLISILLIAGILFGNAQFASGVTKKEVTVYRFQQMFAEYMINYKAPPGNTQTCVEVNNVRPNDCLTKTTIAKIAYYLTTHGYFAIKDPYQRRVFLQNQGKFYPYVLKKVVMYFEEKYQDPASKNYIRDTWIRIEPVSATQNITVGEQTLNNFVQIVHDDVLLKVSVLPGDSDIKNLAFRYAGSEYPSDARFSTVSMFDYYDLLPKSEIPPKDLDRIYASYRMKKFADRRNEPEWSKGEIGDLGSEEGTLWQVLRYQLIILARAAKANISPSEAKIVMEVESMAMGSIGNGGTQFLKSSALKEGYTLRVGSQTVKYNSKELEAMFYQSKLSPGRIKYVMPRIEKAAQTFVKYNSNVPGIDVKVAELLQDNLTFENFVGGGYYRQYIKGIALSDLSVLTKADQASLIHELTHYKRHLTLSSQGIGYITEEYLPFVALDESIVDWETLQIISQEGYNPNILEKIGGYQSRGFVEPLIKGIARRKNLSPLQANEYFKKMFDQSVTFTWLDDVYGKPGFSENLSNYFETYNAYCLRGCFPPFVTFNPVAAWQLKQEILAMIK